MKAFLKTLGWLVLVGILSATLVAQTGGAARYDRDIQSRVAQQFASKAEFRNLQAGVEDGIVTLTGSVNLYQQKLDAAKKVRKMDKVQGVRNLIEVSSTAPDARLAAQLDRKLYFDRIGYGNQFNYITASVQDGVATLSGETRTDLDRDSALWIASNMPGVKEVVNDIRVAPVSNYDDDIRIRAMRAIYRDPVLGRYASDPAAPIRIVVNNGKLSLYGTVENVMDKNVAGIRAGQIFGVFSVQNNLEVASKS
ncbi:MAG TPA: BON domain-containing protein [Terriglobales bacterium]|jgi:osmotically-inducible protein OsmY|nr:BON domain-containing protein [Terriglobales bacterium]